MASEMTGKHGFGKETFPSSLYRKSTWGAGLYSIGGAGVGTSAMRNCFDNHPGASTRR